MQYIDKFEKDTLEQFSRNLRVGERNRITEGFFSATIREFLKLEEEFNKRASFTQVSIFKKSFTGEESFVRYEVKIQSPFFSRFNEFLNKYSEDYKKRSFVKIVSSYMKIPQIQTTDFFAFQKDEDLIALKNCLIDCFDELKMAIENKIPYFKINTIYETKKGNKKEVNTYVFYSGQVFVNGQELKINVQNLFDSKTLKAVKKTVDRIRLQMERERPFV